MGYKEMSSILVDQYRPRMGAQMRGEGGDAGSQPMSKAVPYTGAQINFGDLTTYLTYILENSKFPMLERREI